MFKNISIKLFDYCLNSQYNTINISCTNVFLMVSSGELVNYLCKNHFIISHNISYQYWENFKQSIDKLRDS